MNKKQVRAISQMSKHNVIVHQYYQLFVDDKCTWIEALQGMVLDLSTSNNTLVQRNNAIPKGVIHIGERRIKKDGEKGT